LKDATGWRFAISNGTKEALLFTVWLSSELIERLEHDGSNPFDQLLRAGEKLAEDRMLKPDEMWRKHKTIELGIRDRVRLLIAAGRDPDFLLPSEAPLEAGVPILYELTASGFGSWVGDYLTVSASSEFGDVIVDWSYSDGRRAVRTVRLKTPISATKREAVSAALRAYAERCRRQRSVAGEWVKAVEARL
jgi:hypothetical protein